MSTKNSIYTLTFMFSFSISILEAQNQPVTFNPNMLAHSQGLPNDLLLFSTDSCVQILSNPARAISYTRSFVYLNYLPNSLSPITLLRGSFLCPDINYTGPTVSGVALFDAQGYKWLLHVSNYVNQRESEENSNTNTNQEYTYYTPPSISKYNYINNTPLKINESVTAIKLSLIDHTKDDAYSLGAFLILPMQGNDIAVDVVSDYKYQPDSLYSINEIYKENIKLNIKNSKYVAGLEFSMAGSEWDFISNFVIQKNRYQRESICNEAMYRTYISSTDTRHYFSAENLTQFTKTNEPLIYSIYGFYQQSANMITPYDHYFVSLNAYYYKGKLFDRIKEDHIYYSHYSSGYEYNDTYMEELFNKDEKTEDFGFWLSTGYLSKYNFNDLDILIGLNPQFKYDEYKDAGSCSIRSSLTFPFIMYKHKLTYIALQIPIYLEYSPARWCSFFGGLNYKYAHVNDKYDSSLDLTQTEYSKYYYESNTLKSGKSSFLSSSKDIYAGMVLKHECGIQLKTSFRGNLATISNWNVTLGYIF